MMKKGILVAVLALGAAACRDPLDIGNFSLTGRWQGRVYLRPTAETDSVRYTFSLDLTQDQRNVSGTSTIRAGTDSVRTTVDGRWSYPDVTLTMTAPDYAPITFSGQFVRSDSISGTLQGSGFDGKAFSIVRQP